jgi:hypothetical protein
MEMREMAAAALKQKPPGSSDPHVQEVVRAAHEGCANCTSAADVMKRIGTVKQTIVGLANLFGDTVPSEELLVVDRKSVAASRDSPRLPNGVDGIGFSPGVSRGVRKSSSEFRRYCCATGPAGVGHYRAEPAGEYGHRTVVRGKRAPGGGGWRTRRSGFAASRSGFPASSL